jgi:hypothetical protein
MVFLWWRTAINRINDQCLLTSCGIFGRCRAQAKKGCALLLKLSQIDANRYFEGYLSYLVSSSARCQSALYLNLPLWLHELVPLQQQQLNMVEEISAYNAARGCCHSKSSLLAAAFIKQSLYECQQQLSILSLPRISFLSLSSWQTLTQ